MRLSKPLPLAIMALIIPACAPNTPPSEAVPPPSERRSQDDPPSTVVPVPSSETRSQAAGWRGRSWLQQHQDGTDFLKENQADLVLIGDSITQSFGGEGRNTGQPGSKALTAALPNMTVANQGISGDRTQHVLWRLDHNALAGTCPAHIALMIGTNNLPHDSAPDIINGIERIVHHIRLLCPNSTVLLHAVPPRGLNPDNPMRTKVTNINDAIRRIGQTDGVTWVDPWSDAILDDGDLDPEVMAGDGVHLSFNGYRTWARALQTAMAKTPGS